VADEHLWIPWQSPRHDFLLVCAYVTTGQYDVALVVEMPNGDAMTQLAVAITSSGNARTTTVRAFTPEEFGKLAAEAPAMT
jgi:uncharacterized protein with GYD domain